MSSETLATILFIVVVGITVAITFWASRQNKGDRRLLRRRPHRSAASRTAWPSPATT